MLNTQIIHPVIQKKHRRHNPIQSLYIEPATLADYQRLSHYHYRRSALGPIAGIWVVRSRIASWYIENEPIAVIVYTYPAPNLAVRNIATRKFFRRSNQSEGLALLNRHVRCISRIIVRPQWRGLGLASWLVRATMPMMDVAMIESMAAMGRFHPFLEKARMRPFTPPTDPAARKLIATLESLHIGRDIRHDPDTVQIRMNCLSEKKAQLLERAIKAFLGRFGKRRKMTWGIDRTTFLLEHLSQQWAYFAWLNPKIPVEGLRLTKTLNINRQFIPQGSSIDNYPLSTEVSHVA
jgi:GNAT superfamily N-acetyltransferase